jgi:predicted ATPase/class 3 adenylate cyclase
MNNLPTGTVTFLFTDIEASTKLAQEHPDTWDALRKRHDDVMQSAIDEHNGYVFNIIGDAFCASFHTAGDALRAAIKSQIDLHQEIDGNALVKVRMGIHTGKAELLESGDYQGYMTLSRIQRLMSAGHGGQTLISQATQELIRDEMPEGISLRDLGDRRLKDLIRPEHIHQLVIPNLPADFPPLKTLDIYRHNLPAQTTSFIGREKEMAEIKLALEKHRLVTLTGSGGTGKTRLSLQVAAELVEQYPDGVWFIELAPLTDPALIPQTMLSVLGVSEQQGKSALQSLTDHIHEKKLLFILDNCEHLIEACAKVADSLLSDSQALKILASSREALGVKGEMAWHVPSLSMPDMKQLPTIEQLSQYEAVRLFIERASLAQQHFTVTKDNAPAIAQICFRLDGIPLAIELAAARVKVIKAEQIAERLTDRFRLLTGGSRTALPRQQTLRAMIDWSYDLLAENEKLLLRRLAVFTGGWTLELAEQICSDEKIDALEVLDMLGRLVDKSLVSVNEDDAETRFRMLETVRQYAREKLFESGEGELIRDRHAQCFLQFAEKAEPEIRGRDQLHWLNLLELDHDNLRAALEWTRDHDINACLRLATILWRLWDLRSYNTDAFTWADQLLDLTEGVSPAVRAKALVSAANYFGNSQEADRVKRMVDMAALLAEQVNDKASLAVALRSQGQLLMFANLQAALELFERSLALCRQINDSWEMSITLYMLGLLAANFQNDRPRALSLYEEGIQQARLSGDRRRISLGLAYLAFLNLDQGNPAAARTLYVEGLALVREIEDRRVIHERLGDIAMVDIFLEDYTQAEKSLNLICSFSREVGDPAGLIPSLLNLGVIAWARGDLTLFAEKLAEALPVAGQLNNRLWIANVLFHQSVCDRLNRKWSAARENLTQSLKLNIAENVPWGIYGCLDAFGILATAQGSAERAALLFGAAQKMRDTIPPWAEFPIFRRDRESALASARSALGNIAFAEAYAKGQAMTSEEAIKYAFEETK